MIQVHLYHNGSMRIFYFNNLLDGLIWLENKLFDYIVIDNETTVKCEDISHYIDKLNTYSKKTYGAYYTR